MFSRLPLAAALAVLLIAAPALATPPPVPHFELSQMSGRWYEVARTPNILQRGCHAGTVDWTRVGDGFSVLQACLKGDGGAPTQWKARATVADKVSNARFRLAFFGGLTSQEYWVLDHRPDQGWLILATANGRYMWLMSQRPNLAAAARAQAVARIRQLGFDPSRLEFPSPARG